MRDVFDVLILARLSFAACLCITASCAEERSPLPPEANFEVFEAQVYPILVRDCGFPACHGSEGRFFQVFGPGRMRLNPNSAISQPATPEEVQAAFDRSRGMLASFNTAEGSLFVRKPLAVDLGGAPHVGATDSGRDVYNDREDRSYNILRSWARAALGQEN